MENILFVDGENFKKKIYDVFEDYDQKRPTLHEYNFSGLFSKVLQDIETNKKIFYSAKLSEHKDTLKKSKLLIEEQRLLKTHLERTGFEFMISGRVRGHVEKVNSREILIFKEKGVDVRIAVDMVTMACDGNLKTAVIASSDSDIQPAIKELRKRGVDCVYVGFENGPNKGLTYTTNRTILIRNSEVIEFSKVSLL